MRITATFPLEKGALSSHHGHSNLKLKECMQRIALLNTAFLGDTVLTLPLARLLKTAFPAAHIDFIVRRGLGSLYAAQPEFSQVLELDKRGSQRGLGALWRFGRRLAADRYDCFIGAQQGARSSLLALLSGAPRRIGYAGSLVRRLCYTDCVDRRFAQLEEIERLLELARPLGLCPPADPPHPVLVLPQAVHDEAAALWQALGLDDGTPVLGIHPGSVWPTKRWTLEGYARIARQALRHGASVLLFAGPDEMDIAQALQRAIVAGRADSAVISEADAVRSALSDVQRGVTDNAVLGNVQEGAVGGTEEKGGVGQRVEVRSDIPGVPRLHSLAGRLSLPLLAACIARLSVYLGNDSGPLHLAWSQGVPVVALFGPTVRGLGFFPRGPRASVHEVALDCRPCGLHGHRRCPQGHHRCMRDLDTDAIWEDVAGKLGRIDSA